MSQWNVFLVFSKRNHPADDGTLYKSLGTIDGRDMDRIGDRVAEMFTSTPAPQPVAQQEERCGYVYDRVIGAVCAASRAFHEAHPEIDHPFQAAAEEK